MTKLRLDEWFRFTPAQSRKAGRVEKLGLAMVACIVFMLCIATAIASAAPILTTLVNFDGTNGSSPTAQLVQGTDGNFYGTTHYGGTHDYGTVFKIIPGGTLTTLHSFDGHDGSQPNGLMQGTDGNFYGTTYQGGTSSFDCFEGSCGTVFKITPEGILTTLHRFDATEGNEPLAELVQATNGNFYGTTVYGGADDFGTVFKITPGGILTILHSFGPDGAYPAARLVQGTDGNFYGTTFDATVFKITPEGILTTLHSFSLDNGLYPRAGLVQGTDGNFYSTTYLGGTNSSCPAGCGTVFKITPEGTLTTLHSFNGHDGKGRRPWAGPLVQATSGNFFGTASAGGAGDFGTVFKITPEGTLTGVHSFDGTDGSTPLAGLVQGTDGNFYGTTAAGGANGAGTVFSLNTGLGPFVETRPICGKVGAAVIILGNDLTGATGVSFNGTAAAFTVVSSTEITTTVPDGATTGKVEVTTPGGTLTSNVKFHVR